jgi:pterin-4a-carbinolamine dehydratase
VIQYATFIQAAGAQAGAADTEEARRAVQAVIAAVAASLEESDRDRLAAVLPGSLRGAAEIRGPGLHPDSGAALVSAVSAGSGCPAERARFYTQAVLSTLAGSEPELASVLAERLPDGEELFSPINQGVPPRRSGVPIGLTPRLLEPGEIDRALAALEGWEGDVHRLRRTVVLPPERQRPLRAAVARAEQDMTHHARVEELRDAITFEVWTHSLDRVTDMDLELARRIDAVIAAVGSSG